MYFQLSLFSTHLATNVDIFISTPIALVFMGSHKNKNSLLSCELSQGRINTKILLDTLSKFQKIQHHCFPCRLNHLNDTTDRYVYRTVKVILHTVYRYIYMQTKLCKEHRQINYISCETLYEKSIGYSWKEFKKQTKKESLHHIDVVKEGISLIKLFTCIHSGKDSHICTVISYKWNK